MARKDSQLASWPGGDYGGDRAMNPSDNINDTAEQPVRFLSGIVENQHGPMDQSLPFGVTKPPDLLGYVKGGPMTVNGEEER